MNNKVRNITQFFTMYIIIYFALCAFIPVKAGAFFSEYDFYTCAHDTFLSVKTQIDDEFFLDKVSIYYRTVNTDHDIDRISSYVMSFVQWSAQNEYYYSQGYYFYYRDYKLYGNGEHSGGGHRAGGEDPETLFFYQTIDEIDDDINWVGRKKAGVSISANQPLNPELISENYYHTFNNNGGLIATWFFDVNSMGNLAMFRLGSSSNYEMFQFIDNDFDYETRNYFKNVFKSFYTQLGNVPNFYTRLYNDNGYHSGLFHYSITPCYNYFDFSTYGNVFKDGKNYICGFGSLSGDSILTFNPDFLLYNTESSPGNYTRASFTGLVNSFLYRYEAGTPRTYNYYNSETLISSYLNMNSFVYDSGVHVCHGDSIVKFSDGCVIYKDGKLYNVEMTGDNYIFEPDNGNNYTDVHINDICTTVINQYITNVYIVSGNTVSGNGSTYDDFKVVFYLKLINDKLNQLSDYIMSGRMIQPILDALVNIGGGTSISYNQTVSVNLVQESVDIIDQTITNAMTNTYNYMFVLNEDQQEQINLKIDEMKQPFGWFFDIFAGFGGFLNDIKAHAAVYSTGSGYGSAGDFVMHDLGFSVSNNSVSGNTTISSFGSYVPVPVSNIDNPPEVVGGGDHSGGGARIGSAPKLKADFSLATSDINYGGEAVILDLDWYLPYKPTADKIIIAFAWCLFLFRLIKALPGIIHGESAILNKDN